MNNKSCQYSPLKELLIRHSSGEMDACEREFTTALRVYRAARPSVRLSVCWIHAGHVRRSCVCRDAGLDSAHKTI